MSNINLMPWREVVKQREKTQFFILLGGSAFVAALLVLAVNMIFGQLVQGQVERNQFLTNEMVVLDTQLGEINQLKKRKKELIDRMKLIDELQQKRNLPVHLFNELPALVSNGVYLKSLDLAADNINVVGDTEAYSRVASMVRQIEKSGWLGQPHISSIFSTGNKPIALSQFSAQFKVIPAPLGSGVQGGEK
ncbi:PilN domain-containing protein [Pseudaeromonas paramecii]|uniref:PilN family type IV pilus biogenesis protein TapN n=1 Tax=Pseudaeromonas paramecii TaxID=2138166 RepID=A0ABP8QA70_9GAMM